MSGELGERRIVVTGAQPGPRALAEALTASGARVALVDAGFESEDSVRASISQAETDLGGIDQVVHAWLPDAAAAPVDFMDVDEARWQDGCEAGLAAAWWLTRQAITPLLSSRGSLVFLVPTIGMSGAAGLTMLASIAEGIRGLAKGVGRQLGTQGVTVNTIAAAPHLWLAEATAAAVASSVSLSKPAFGRFGTWEHDMASLVALLGRPEADFVTASTVVADGGLWMGL
jgi:NAD(P)-dependent dehydrogenase (short-subunit alcohol dehydrogenase family)